MTDMLEVVTVCADMVYLVIALQAASVLLCPCEPTPAMILLVLHVAQRQMRQSYHRTVIVFQRHLIHITDWAGRAMVDSKVSPYGVRVVGRRDRKASDGVCQVSMLS
jgi:hypothetical protein